MKSELLNLGQLSEILFYLGLLCFLLKRLLRYLRILQQEDYQTGRFFNWLRSHSAYDKRGSGVCLMALLCWSLNLPLLAKLSSGGAWLGLAELEEDPRHVGKVKLNMTARAKRIFFLACILATLAWGLVCYLAPDSPTRLFYCFALIQLNPFFLPLSVILLRPDEARRQSVFLREARENLEKIKPFVIGITGSYGKTSTKAVLGALLDSSLGPTYFPPKSVNTPMGISRELREVLEPRHKYAVIEMGAYGIGSIARLCKIAPPQAAIITAVGEMHLERFGSRENILKAKSELAQSLPPDGILVVNGDNPGARKIAELYPGKTTLLYGLEPEAGKLDCLMSEIEVGPEGTRFSIKWGEQCFKGQTRLYGRPNLSNILAAFTMAVALGAKPDYVIALIRGLVQYENRLEVVKLGQGYQINDAYNSNPVGFKAALEVMQGLKGKKKILMTPGMIELGEEQASENKRLAEIAARVCTEVIIVGETNRESILSGLRAAGFKEEQIHPAPDRTAAFAKLAEIRGPEDVVLIENDLTDLYESTPQF